MSESANQTGNDGANSTPAPPPSANDNTSSSNSEPSNVESLPQWAQTTIHDLRNEAAGHRVKAREAAEEARKAAEETHNAKVAELNQQIETHKTDADTAKSQVLKLSAVLDAGVPGDRATEVAERVRGNTEEEIRQDAKRIAELFGSQRVPATDPSQGLGKSTATDPASQFGEFILGQIK